MQDKLILPNGYLQFAEEELREGRSVTILADGCSMVPFIKGGKDKVEIRPLEKDETLQPLCCPFYKWNGHYMIHRYIGNEGSKYVMLGDGNLGRYEYVERGEILGVLTKIHHQDGSIQDCCDPRWIRKARIWKKLLPVRRILLAIARRLPGY